MPTRLHFKINIGIAASQNVLLSYIAWALLVLFLISKNVLFKVMLFIAFWPVMAVFDGEIMKRRAQPFPTSK